MHLVWGRLSNRIKAIPRGMLRACTLPRHWANRGGVIVEDLLWRAVFLPTGLLFGAPLWNQHWQATTHHFALSFLASLLRLRPSCRRMGMRQLLRAPALEVDELRGAGLRRREALRFFLFRPSISRIGGALISVLVHVRILVQLPLHRDLG